MVKKALQVPCCVLAELSNSPCFIGYRYLGQIVQGVADRQCARPKTLGRLADRAACMRFLLCVTAVPLGWHMESNHNREA
jgi:hypothetical protein